MIEPEISTPIAVRHRGRRRAMVFLLCALPLLLAGCGNKQLARDMSALTSTSEVAQIVTPVFTVAPTEMAIPVETTVPVETETPVPTDTPPTWVPIEISTDSEQAATGDLLAGEAGVYGVVVFDQNGNFIVSHNAHLPFVTASTYKLIVIANLLTKVENGELDLNEPYVLDPELFARGGGDMYFANDDAGDYATLEELLYAAGAYSSNVAGLTMLRLTDLDSLRETAEQIGMYETWILSDPYSLPIWPPTADDEISEHDAEIARDYIAESAELGPVNITSAYDLATYMYALAHGTLISPFVSDHIMGILEDQLIRDRLPYLQQPDVKVIDKPGNLDDVVNDAGILYLPNGEVRSVALLAQDVVNDDHATQVEQRLALIAAGNFDIPPYYKDASGTPPPR